MRIPIHKRIGKLTVVHTPQVRYITVQKPGLLVPAVVHQIGYDSLSEAGDKQTEAEAWAENNQGI